MLDWIIAIVVGGVFLYWGLTRLFYYFHHLKAEKRAPYIDDYQFPDTIFRKVWDRYPHLTKEDLVDVEDGLRDYFHLCNKSANQLVSMPSQVVDAAWHEFILFTRQYADFCEKAFGGFLHHTPAEAMAAPDQAGEGIKRAWRLACERADIKPAKPHMLPLLFRLDARLKIPDGFVYQRRCDPRTATTAVGAAVAYCASHIGCSSGCAGASGDGDGGDGGCGGGCGGGD